MYYRKRTRFLTLSVACAASLVLGAFLSYAAAPRPDGAVAAAAKEAPAAPVSIVAGAPPARPAAKDDSFALRVSLEPSESNVSSQPAVFTQPEANETPLGLRTLDPETEAALAGDPPPDAQQQNEVVAEAAPEAAAAAQDQAPQAGNAPQAKSSLQADDTPQADELPPGASAPLPPPRPDSLPGGANSASAAVTPPAQRQGGAIPVLADALAALTDSVGGSDAVEPPAPTPLPARDFKRGARVFLRIFKREGILELWMKHGETYALFKSFPICKWSGHLGPKLRSADLQSPEGFYEVSARQLNPHSHFDLAFNIGYPNAYDRAHGATGSAIMVHGDCKSVGCFAMTNHGIEQIYHYVALALAHGQREVPVDIFPFRMTDAAIARESQAGNVLAFMSDGAPPTHNWAPFWRNLKQGYDIFQRTHIPPVAYACDGRYAFNKGGRSCTRIAGR